MKKMSDLFYTCAYNMHYETAGNDVNYAFVEDGDTLYIYFEGSKDIKAENGWIDWLRNFWFFPTWKKPYKDMDIPYRVHSGFLSAWKEVDDIIINKITELADDEFRWKNIIVVGYSHGAALSFFAAECVWYWRPDINAEHTHTFAFESPRVLAKWHVPSNIKERWANMTVIRTGKDLVTHVPPRLFRFCHAGEMLKLDGDPSLVEDKVPTCIKYHFPQVVYDALRRYEEEQEAEKAE